MHAIILDEARERRLRRRRWGSGADPSRIVTGRQRTNNITAGATATRRAAPPSPPLVTLRLSRRLTALSEVLLRLRALPLQQLLLLRSEMAHLPARWSRGLKASTVAPPLLAGWLTAGRVRLTAAIVATPRRTKRFLSTRHLCFDAAPRRHSGRPNIAALDPPPMSMRSPRARSAPFLQTTLRI